MRGLEQQLLLRVEVATPKCRSRWPNSARHPTARRRHIAARKNSDQDNAAGSVAIRTLPPRDSAVSLAEQQEIWIPTAPEFAPSIVSPRRLTKSLAPGLIVMAAPLVARIPAAAPSLVMLTALLIVTGP